MNRQFIKNLLIFAVMLLPVSAFAQNAQQNARIKEVREMYSKTQSVMKDMAETASNNWYMTTEAVVNESAVGPVKYNYSFWSASFMTSDAGNFARLQRTVTVFPADVYEILYNADGTPAFYYLMERSYHDEGCHTDTRIYWNKDGKTVCFVSREEVANGKKTPVTLNAEEKEQAVAIANGYASDIYKKCIPFFETAANDDEEENIGDDYLGHSMRVWSEYRVNMESLLPKYMGKTQKIKECAYLDIDSDDTPTTECIARTDCGQIAVFTNGNADGIATDDFKLVSCFDEFGTHLIPSGHAVITYEGAANGYERENIYIIDKNKVKTVYSFSSDPQGGNKIKSAYKKLDKATGKTTILKEADYEAIKKKVGDKWHSFDNLEWWDF